MASNPSDQPHGDHVPGPWPSNSANSFRADYLSPAEPTHLQSHTPADSDEKSHSLADNISTIPYHSLASEKALEAPNESLGEKVDPAYSLERPIVANDGSETSSSDGLGDSEKMGEARQLEPINTNKSREATTSDAIFKALSRRRTNASGRQGSFSSHDPNADDVEQAEIERLMSRMFGRNRQANSEEEKTRHVGVVFKDLTVKGLGLGAALQPTLGDIFLGLPRLIKGLLTKGSKGAPGKPPIRTILNNFTGCVKPGEMLLVLGRPGSGCSTFLKVLANQRFGYQSVDGEVTYGGTDAATMGKDYRGEILYNPEDGKSFSILAISRSSTTLI